MTGSRNENGTGPGPDGLNLPDASSAPDSAPGDATIPPPDPGRGSGSPDHAAASPSDATIPPPGAGSGGGGVWRTPSGGSTPGSPAHGSSSPVPATAVPPGSKPTSRGPVLILVALIAVLAVLLCAIAWKLLQDDSEPAAEPAVPFVDTPHDGPLPDTLQCPAEGLCHTRKDDALDTSNAEEVNEQAVRALADVARTSEPGAPYPQTLEFDVPNQQAHYTCRHIGAERYTSWDCRTMDLVAGTPGFQVISAFNSQGLGHFRGTIADPDWRNAIISYVDRRPS